MQKTEYGFSDACAFIRQNAQTEREKGALFEKLIARWLQVDPYWSTVVDKVWLWEDFVRQLKKELQKGILTNADMGIDLVARLKGGRFMAVQCKFYGPDTVMSKAAVDSFIAECGKIFVLSDGEHAFSSALWIHEGGTFGKNALDSVRGQRIPFTLVSGEDIARAEGIDWAALVEGREPAPRHVKELRPHQQEALEAARIHYANHARGKLIMACGTGKTLVSLRIVEQGLAGRRDGLVLFCVPSIALLSQTLNAWMADRDQSKPMHAICVCSDPKASKKTGDEDSIMDGILDIAYPASTSPEAVVRQLQDFCGSGTTVVFSTYQSLEVVCEAQKRLLLDKDMGGLGVFDWIVCDEAHRTTGACAKGAETSSFVRIHDDGFIKAKRRLYMTATPKMYKETAKQKASEADTILWSMDDEDVYGKRFYYLKFSEAIDHGLLTDYKVFVLALPSSIAGLGESLRHWVQDPDAKEINVDEASRLSGVFSALGKQISGDGSLVWESDPGVMKRGIVFCGRIGNEAEPGSSKNIAKILPKLTASLADGMPESKRRHAVRVQARHVDGSMSAAQRNEALAWLREGPQEPQECRLLCNVRCLSEGVDVPALDAVVYLAPRRSQIDVVQSVGRIMRNFRKGQEGEKRYGYVILPIVVPPNVKPEDALADNERFRAVWEVLDAIRAHDERFDALINQIELNERKPDKLTVFAPPEGAWWWEDGQEEQLKASADRQQNLLRTMLYARIVEKVGNRFYWDAWAMEAGAVAKKLIQRIKELLDMSEELRGVFDEFMDALRENLNPDVQPVQAFEMLAQTMITAPIFDVLFPQYQFDENNAVSSTMQAVLGKFREQGLFKDTSHLNKFYDRFKESIRMNVKEIDNIGGKQAIIKTLYEKFFKRAFPLMVEKLGIVYTPIELVDFTLHSANAVLKKEFGKSMADRGIHILDPFTGTGSFITRLLQEGLAGSGKELLWKYSNEVHANEITLLAYYVADVNIEAVFNDIWQKQNPGAKYERYNGIVWTDTFEQYERKVHAGEARILPGMKTVLLGENTAQIKRQQKAPIRVIVGNPPYSAGQKSANDNAQNQKYPKLEKRIEATYAAESNATLKTSLYDTYVKAFRWASDRIKEMDGGGVVAFVTNAGWLDGAAAAGMRRCMEREFSAVYIVNLRGDCRTSGELAKREGGAVFLSCRTPIAITILVKKPDFKGKAVIRYFEVEDYMSRDDKLKLLKESRDVSSLPMQTLEPDEYGDWLNHRDRRFEGFVSIGDKKAGDKKGTVFCGTYSIGLKTQRDAWIWNFSKRALAENVQRMIGNYNACIDSGEKDMNPRKISWSNALLDAFAKKQKLAFVENAIVEEAMYRPFTKEYVYFSKDLNERRGKLPVIFPNGSSGVPVICVSGSGVKKEFSCLMVNCLPDLELVGKSQCFPLRWLDDGTEETITGSKRPDVPSGMTSARRTRSVSLFEAVGTKKSSEGVWRDGVTDWALRRCHGLYPSRTVSKEDIFYYVYGLLHSREYRQEFAADLKKSLPRIPFPDSYETFDAFSRAGRRLADIHLHYEEQEPWPGVQIDGTGSFKVEKPCWLDKPEKTTLRLNASIVLRNIPARAHEYVVCGKSALDWLVERYAVRTDKDSGIVNDANAWAEEHGRERYVLDLFLSVITVCMKTLDIVDSLPRLVFGEDGSVMEEAPEAPEI